MQFYYPEFRAFFEAKLQPHQFIKKNDGFNMSMLRNPLNDQQLLVAVRFLGTPSAYFGEEVIPGNFSNQYVAPQVVDKIGKNFFWNRWLDQLIDNTIIFMTDLQFNPIESYQPLVICLTTIINGCSYTYSDIRLIASDNKIFLHNGNVSEIYQVKLDSNGSNSRIMISLKKNRVDGLLTKTDVCSSTKTYDKNWSFLKIENNTILFLDWFRDKHVTVSVVPLNSSVCSTLKLIEMKGDVIEGIGNDFSPMFSFGTPSLQINDSFYGCGHLKIIRSKKYKSEKLMKMQSTLIERNLQSKTHINHNSYTYCIFYYRLDWSEKRMLISDGFLYISKSDDRPYTFNINFPLGLILIEDSFLLSYGYGDYYNVILQQSIDDFNQKVKHDVSSFSYSAYDYHVVDMG